MSHSTLSVLAFTGGVFLAIQGGLNAQLGVFLKNPLLASLVAFFCSAGFAFLIVIFSIKSIPSTEQLSEVPNYLWFAGGIFSVVGISLYYYTIPKLGVSTMISLGLCGQLIFSVIAGHFGWFGMPVESVDTKRLLGVLAMIVGIFLINKK